MKKFVVVLRVITILMVVFAAIGCCFPAITETLVPFFPDKFADGGEMVENLHFPLLVALLVAAAVRVVLLLLRKLPTDVISCVLGVPCVLWMAAMPTFLDAIQPMGGLAGYQYTLTFFGAIAVLCGALSFLSNVLLCIFAVRERVKGNEREAL